MITYFYISLAAIFNAVMDTLWTHYSVSVFMDLNPRWWNPNESWKYVNNWLGWVRFDAWHLAKMGMIGGITGAIVTYSEYHLYDWILIPIVWSISFELFYSLILKSKTT